MNLSNAIKNRRLFSIRAIRDWIEFNGGTTHIGVVCSYPGVQVPEHHIVDDAITLNISSKSCERLKFDEKNNQITFGARFNKVNFDIVIPAKAIFAIWERHTNVGEQYPVIFEDNMDPALKQEPETKAPAASHLKIVK